MEFHGYHRIVGTSWWKGLLIDVSNIKEDGLPVDGVCTARTCNIHGVFIALFRIHSIVCSESGKLPHSYCVHAVISTTCDIFN